MIEWEKISSFNRPTEWDTDGSDGVYGDIDALEASCNAGEEQVVYLMRLSTQGVYLAKLTGSIPAPQVPQGLDPDEEEPLC